MFRTHWHKIAMMSFAVEGFCLFWVISHSLAFSRSSRSGSGSGRDGSFPPDREIDSPGREVDSVPLPHHPSNRVANIAALYRGEMGCGRIFEVILICQAKFIFWMGIFYFVIVLAIQMDESFVQIKLLIFIVPHIEPTLPLLCVYSGQGLGVDSSLGRVGSRSTKPHAAVNSRPPISARHQQRTYLTARLLNVFCWATKYIVIAQNLL